MLSWIYCLRAPLLLTEHSPFTFPPIASQPRLRMHHALTQGIPETMLFEFIPQKFIMPPAPFRTIAEMSACLPWLLRVHHGMQYISQLPTGLMTVQRLICPAASPENGGLAAEGGVLAVDWAMIEQARVWTRTRDPSTSRSSREPRR